MNISKHEQRVLHALAQGGAIHLVRDPSGAVLDVDCMTRDGYRLGDCTSALFARLKRRGLVTSRNGGPYRISRFGIDCVRAQLDNR